MLAPVSRVSAAGFGRALQFPVEPQARIAHAQRFTSTVWSG